MEWGNIENSRGLGRTGLWGGVGTEVGDCG